MARFTPGIRQISYVVTKSIGRVQLSVNIRAVFRPRELQPAGRSKKHYRSCCSVSTP